MKEVLHSLEKSVNVWNLWFYIQLVFNIKCVKHGFTFTLNSVSNVWSMWFCFHLVIHSTIFLSFLDSFLSGSVVLQQ